MALLAAYAYPAGPSESPALPSAFPDAEGYGRHTVGGHGGRVISVTTLDDAGPGSLRACIDATGPRVCIFKVGGVIRFTTIRPIIRNPYLTIAGQTAPGGGITLTHAGGRDGLTPLVVKNTHDVIVRHIRVRPDRVGEVRAANSAFIIENSRNVVFDHVSASWALDENIGGFGDNDNVTISWSIFAKGIRTHDKCALLASDPKVPQHLSFIKNLCAHNGDRNPDINFPPMSCVEVINNVLYNGVSEFAEVWESYGGTPVNIISNYFKAGPNTVRGSPVILRRLIETKGPARIYLNGNFVGKGLTLEGEGVREVLQQEPVCPIMTNIYSAEEAYRLILRDGGAFPRDSFDQAIVDDVKNGTGSITQAAGELPPISIGTPYLDSDEDGMSDIWEQTNGTDPKTYDPWDIQSGERWSNLDRFLDYAHQHVVSGGQVQ